jgi:Ca2+-binding EF-hand superfamily protein
MAIAPGLALAQVRSTTPGAGATGAAVVSQGHDLVFFADTRPVLLRLHVQVDGKSLIEKRHDYVRQWLTYLDRSRDGALDNKEAQFVPRVQILQQMIQGGIIFPGPNIFAPFAELDRDNDSKVSLDELVQHFERAGFNALQLAPAPGNSGAISAANNALFRHLDKKQGKLAKEDLASLADTLMRKLDGDDDELLTLAELGGTAGANQGFGGAVVVDGRQPAPTGLSFILINPSAPSAQLTQRLISLYDKDRSGKLSFEESGLRRSAFAKLDGNEDGQLDPSELANLPKQTPALELTVRLGKTAEAMFEANMPGKRKDEASLIEKGKDGSLMLKLGDAQIALQRPNTDTRTLALRTQQFYTQQFAAADTKKNGYLEIGDLKDQAFQALRLLFPMLDKDQDGKMTRQEIDAFVQLQTDSGKCFATLSIQEFGRGLVQLLDANRDGLLSVRELRTAWPRLEPLDKNGDGCITADEITRQIQMSLSPGASNLGRQFVVVSPDGMRGERPMARPANSNAPLWFQRMDKNGDGDISFKEFLGSREDFNRIDADSDGLIDADEAARYDATLRPAKKRDGR